MPFLRAAVPRRTYTVSAEEAPAEASAQEQPAAAKAEVKPEKTEKTEKKTTGRQPAAQRAGQSGAQKAGSAPKNQNANSRQPQQKLQQGQSRPQTNGDSMVKKPAVRIVDTRTTNVNIDKYNEKYDRLANEKVRTDNTVNKQKLNQRSRQERGKPRNARRETEAERMRRIQLERQKKPMNITLPEELTVGELALRLKATSAEVIKKLMAAGVFATVNDTIDFDTAALVAMEFNARAEKEVVVTIEDRIIDDSEDDDANLVPRAPVVVVMGHVDHGKDFAARRDPARQRDRLRRRAALPSISALTASRINDRDITFLDTPGHAAFTTMRARGAQVTDIAVLVVAADDGIMPQTIEAINHAKGGGRLDHCSDQ